MTARLLHFLMSQLQQLRKDGSIDMNDLAVLAAPSFCLDGGWWVVGALTPVHGKVAALAMLRVRIPSLSAALRSTWPIFGILAVIQQNLGRIARSTSGIHGIGMHWKHVARYFMNPPKISFFVWGGLFFFL